MEEGNSIKVSEKLDITADDFNVEEMEMEDNLPDDAQNERPVIFDYKIEYLGAEDEPSDFKRGLISICSREKKQNIYHEQKEVVNFAFLKAKKSRLWMPEYGKQTVGDFKFFCKSEDGMKPTGEGNDPQAGPCISLGDDGKPELDRFKQRIPCCPKASWTKDGKKSIPPECPEFYKLACLDLDTNKPFVWIARGTQFPLVSSFIDTILKKRTHLKESGDQEYIKYNGIKRTTLKFKYSVTAVPKKNYFEPVFKLEGLLNLEKATELDSVYDQISEVYNMA